MCPSTYTHHTCTHLYIHAHTHTFLCKVALLLRRLHANVQNCYVTSHHAEHLMLFKLETMRVDTCIRTCMQTEGLAARNEGLISELSTCKAKFERKFQETEALQVVSWMLWLFRACMHVCMHVCIHVCMSVCLYVCVYVCIYVCLSSCTNSYTSMCMYLHMFECVCMCVYLHAM